MLLKKYAKKLAKKVIRFTKMNIVSCIILFVLIVSFFAWNPNQTTKEYINEMIKISKLGYWLAIIPCGIIEGIVIIYYTLQQAIYYVRASKKQKAEIALNNKVKGLLEDYKAKYCKTID